MVVDTTDTHTQATGDLAWRVDSTCRQHPTQLWFAASPRDIATAKALCGNCTVQSACLDFALSRPELVGIWAATTPSERAVLRRTARTAAATTVAPETEADDVRAEPETARDETVEAGGNEQRAPGEGWLPGDAGPPAPALRRLDTEPDHPRDAADVASDELLTPAEAARRLGVTPNTVTRWSRAGKISAIQTIGGHRRYRSSEVDRVLRHFGSLR
jgi:excisionase family DNA binding protein